MTVPTNYFPPAIDKFNVYGIHKNKKVVDRDSTDQLPRVYEALFPVPGTEPNFHRIQHFGGTQFDGIIAGNKERKLSEIWTKYLE